MGLDEEPIPTKVGLSPPRPRSGRHFPLAEISLAANQVGPILEVLSREEMTMTTTQTTSAGSAGLMWTATVEAPSSGWAGPPRGAIGTLPSYRLRRVTEHIHQNVDKNLRLAELAALVYMSPYHFARLFKGSMGVPPHRFVVRQRIARASAFLATPELSIARDVENPTITSSPSFKVDDSTAVNAPSVIDAVTDTGFNFPFISSV